MADKNAKGWSGIAAVGVATRWKPGHSANPGAKPKWFKTFQSLCREHSSEAFSVLTGIMNDPQARNSDRIIAAVEVLDRAWGKTRDRVDEEQVDVSRGPLDARAYLSDEELRTVNDISQRVQERILAERNASGSTREPGVDS